MLYLFLGYALVGLLILLGIPLEDNLTNGQYVFVILLSIFLDFLPVFGFLGGRYLSKQSKLHWETLLSLGVVVGVATQIMLPRLGLGTTEGDSWWYIPAILFFAIAFIPPKLEKWRFKQERQLTS